MAGSYISVTTKKGKLRNNETFVDAIENLGDAYEAVEELYGMIWYLANGDPIKVEEAHKNYRYGLSNYSPGIQKSR